MDRYLYLKRSYCNKQKIIELIIVIGLFSINTLLSPYTLSLLIFTVIDIDYIKAHQGNNFTKSYYFNTKEKCLFFISNFLIYFIFMLIWFILTKKSINVLEINILKISYYSLTSAAIIQLLLNIYTNKYNLIYCYLILQTLFLVLMKVLIHFS